jgi:hypothetical protein
MDGKAPPFQKLNWSSGRGAALKFTEARTSWPAPALADKVQAQQCALWVSLRKARNEAR